MASMPSMPRPFADSSVKTSVEGVQSADVNRGTLATSGMEGADQSRPSTISIMPAAYVASAGQEVSTPLLSPTPFPNAAQVSESSTNVGQSNDPLPTDRLRSSSFMSHPHQYEALKASNRPRSGSAASNSSGSAMGLPISRGGVAGAFGAVTNLVSNVRHAYSPSISSQTSNAPKASDAPIQRFLDCEVDDLKMSEVALLLADYKRLAARLNEST